MVLLSALNTLLPPSAMGSAHSGAAASVSGSGCAPAAANTTAIAPGSTSIAPPAPTSARETTKTAATKLPLATTTTATPGTTSTSMTKTATTSTMQPPQRAITASAIIQAATATTSMTNTSPGAHLPQTPLHIQLKAIFQAQAQAQAQKNRPSPAEAAAAAVAVAQAVGVPPSDSVQALLDYQFGRHPPPPAPEQRPEHRLKNARTTSQTQEEPPGPSRPIATSASPLSSGSSMSIGSTSTRVGGTSTAATSMTPGLPQEEAGGAVDKTQKAGSSKSGSSNRHALKRKASDGSMGVQPAEPKRVKANDFSSSSAITNKKTKIPFAISVLARASNPTKFSTDVADEDSSGLSPEEENTFKALLESIKTALPRKQEFLDEFPVRTNGSFLFAS
ncbi:hypothetical protein GALMADRAFT_1128856 [Galerina marginata CBS 339.88]|uniref:Uncharacterized protein n=1 Tax=Galerina marginata (strain CBS 339.88) TaxID=685588 RepID=A0A067S891_GALM3|nr:hypothetical protein GALMADRAFT_1128856 [Galerina marginata CBS 339.88]